MAVILCACENDKPQRPTRSDFIKVYVESEDKLLDDIQVPFDGVTDGKIHVLSNLDLQWKYFINPDASDQDWFTIKSVELLEPGHTVVTYDAESLLALNSLSYRSGRLSFSCPEASMGKFMTVRQGYSEKFYEEFSDEPGGHLTITGKKTYTTQEYPVLNSDYYDYISFNAWAESDNEFPSKNITLDITVSGGKFHATDLTTYRINVPLGTGPAKDNLKYLLIMGNDERMSAKTTFTFSSDNDNQVYVHIDNFAAYQVTEADMLLLFDDEEFIEDDEPDWE